MAQARINWPDLGSPLRYYPDYVLQIGLITIEITNLEVMLGDLLGALLDFDDDASHGIYFTPRAAIARMDVLVNVAESPRFDEHPNLRTSVVKIAHRAKALMGQRHDIIHAHGVASDDGKMVGRLRPPFSSDLRREIIALRVLKKLVADIRALIKEARFAMDEIYETLRPDTWPQNTRITRADRRGIEAGQSPPRSSVSSALSPARTIAGVISIPSAGEPDPPARPAAADAAGS
jgi:hypothetical protein